MSAVSDSVASTTANPVEVVTKEVVRQREIYQIQPVVCKVPQQSSQSDGTSVRGWLWRLCCRVFESSLDKNAKTVYRQSAVVAPHLRTECVILSCIDYIYLVLIIWVTVGLRFFNSCV